jgi:DNA-binding transcriptional LysR family regulator
MDELDIQTLRIFLEASRTLNFTEAGRNLGVSQPAISMRIRDLEEHLQVRLFERNSQGIQLTKAGEQLVTRARQIIDLVVQTEESLRIQAGDVVGELVIGSSATVGKYILPQVVSQFRRQYPNVLVSIPIVPRQTMMDCLISGDFDLGVTSLRVPKYDVEYIDLVTDHLSLIAPTGHPWAKRDTIEPHELYAEQFICREPESACRYVVSTALEKVGLDITDLEIVMEVGSAEALAMAVQHGIGLAFVSRLAALPYVALGRLAWVHIEGIELHNTIELVHARGHSASAVRSRFVSFLHQPHIQAQMQGIVAGQFM